MSIFNLRLYIEEPYRHSGWFAKFLLLVELPTGEGHRRDDAQFSEIDAISIEDLVTRIAHTKPDMKERHNR